ncbi:MAG TPA: hypothetical protein VM822_19350 [Pseudolabrys sp.]|jgi:hypothetical protein|nr:hypothetical protein [Pseudolabrys sp.]
MKSTETYTIVAAQPEWFLAIFDTNVVRYEQIIAWEIRRTTSRNGLVVRSFTVPITVEGNNVDLVALSLCTDWAIKRPDGEFVLHSKNLSKELLSQLGRHSAVESSELRVGSPSIANGDPPKPAPQSSLSSPENSTAANLKAPWLLGPG